MANKPARPKPPRLVDRPEISETYADSMGTVIFANGVTHIELCATRWDMPGDIPNPRRVTAARLVLNMQGLVDLHEAISKILGSLPANVSPPTSNLRQ
jgi:hypothetical protein